MSSAYENPPAAGAVLWWGGSPTPCCAGSTPSGQGGCVRGPPGAQPWRPGLAGAGCVGPRAPAPASGVCFREPRGEGGVLLCGAGQGRGSEERPPPPGLTPAVDTVASPVGLSLRICSLAWEAPMGAGWPGSPRVRVLLSWLSLPTARGPVGPCTLGFSFPIWTIMEGDEKVPGSHPVSHS